MRWRAAVERRGVVPWREWRPSKRWASACREWRPSKRQGVALCREWRPSEHARVETIEAVGIVPPRVETVGRGPTWVARGIERRGNVPPRVETVHQIPHGRQAEHRGSTGNPAVACHKAPQSGQITSWWCQRYGLRA